MPYLAFKTLIIFLAKSLLLMALTPVVSVVSIFFNSLTLNCNALARYGNRALFLRVAVIKLVISLLVIQESLPGYNPLDEYVPTAVDNINGLVLLVKIPLKPPNLFH